MIIPSNYKYPVFPVFVDREEIPLNDHLLAIVFSYLLCPPFETSKNSLLQRSIQLALKEGDEALKRSVDKYVTLIKAFFSNFSFKNDDTQFQFDRALNSYEDYFRTIKEKMIWLDPEHILPEKVLALSSRLFEKVTKDCCKDKLDDLAALVNKFIVVLQQSPYAEQEIIWYSERLFYIIRWDRPTDYLTFGNKIANNSVRDEYFKNYLYVESCYKKDIFSQLHLINDSNVREKLFLRIAQQECFNRSREIGYNYIKDNNSDFWFFFNQIKKEELQRELLFSTILSYDSNSYFNSYFETLIFSKIKYPTLLTELQYHYVKCRAWYNCNELEEICHYIMKEIKNPKIQVQAFMCVAKNGIKNTISEELAQSLYIYFESVISPVLFEFVKIGIHLLKKEYSKAIQMIEKLPPSEQKNVMILFMLYRFIYEEDKNLIFKLILIISLEEFLDKSIREHLIEVISNFCDDKNNQKRLNNINKVNDPVLKEELIKIFIRKVGYWAYIALTHD